MSFFLADVARRGPLKHLELCRRFSSLVAMPSSPLTIRTATRRVFEPLENDRGAPRHVAGAQGRGPVPPSTGVCSATMRGMRSSRRRSRACLSSLARGEERFQPATLGLEHLKGVGLELPQGSSPAIAVAGGR